MVSGGRMAVAVRPSHQLGAPRPTSRLLAVDRVILAYLLVATVVAVYRAPTEPGCWWVVLANALVGLLVAFLTRPGLGRFGQILREVYPLLLLVVLYGELDVLNGAGIRVHDDLVQRWELGLFGREVSRDWWQSAPSRFWSTVLHSAYFSYYFIVTIPVSLFLYRDDLVAARRFVLAVMVTFVVCYLAFLFFPVAGPYYVFPRPAAWFLDNDAARLVYDTLAHGSSYGAAFPSSHVAATVAAAFTAWHGSHRLGRVLLVPTVLLAVGVVYCQMHYAVDALAGLVVGGVVGLGVASISATDLLA